MYTYSPILENGYSGILFLYRINEGWCNSCTKNDIYVDRSEAESDTLTIGDPGEQHQLFVCSFIPSNHPFVHSLSLLEPLPIETRSPPPPPPIYPKPLRHRDLIFYFVEPPSQRLDYSPTTSLLSRQSSYSTPSAGILFLFQPISIIIIRHTFEHFFSVGTYILLSHFTFLLHRIPSFTSLIVSTFFHHIDPLIFSRTRSIPFLTSHSFFPLLISPSTFHLFFFRLSLSFVHQLIFHYSSFSRNISQHGYQYPITSSEEPAINIGYGPC